MSMTMSNEKRAPRRASMRDVAGVAGVSTQTVSRVAHGVPRVDPATRQTVLDAMKAVGYRPNLAARLLRSGRAWSIGVILFDLDRFGNMMALEAIASAATPRGYSLTLVPIARDDTAAMPGAIERLLEQGVDGIIAIVEHTVFDTAYVALPSDFPIVILDTTAREGFSRVDNDQAQGARLATEHLLSLGHETVWHVAGPADSASAELRESTWRETLARAGRRVPPVCRGDWSAASGYRLGLEMVANPAITAVFTANDQMALGLLRAATEGGRAVPEELSVVGFDDMIESASFSPPLTTVHQDLREVGRRAVAVLLERIAEPTAPHVEHLVPTSLVVRASTAPPASPRRPG
jgi:DNA-binding LacI/PurR family transcriptional regulator